MRFALSFCIVCLNTWLLIAQTTQGIVTGRVFDRQSTKGIGGATITYLNLATNETGSVRTNAQGIYAIPFLSPGRYRIKAESAPNYQPQTLQRLDLQVAGRVELNFPLRSFAELRQGGLYNGGSVSLAGQREVVSFFGPDVGFAAPLQVLEPKSGTLQPALSYVIESDEINSLPLRGRDPYSLVASIPGTTTDANTTLSLNLSINGQRPSSSNFLLDGVENNDTLNTGTRVQVPPELVESYRVSTNNFSAEFGRTSGFVANVVTRAGSNALHGTVYTYLGNDVFNANSFQDNRQGISRRPDRQLYTGFWAGGPVRKDRLWFSTGFERYSIRGNDNPVRYFLPGAQASAFSVQSSEAAQLLQRFPSPASGINALTAAVTLAPQVAIDQIALLERLDYRSASGANRITGRLAMSRHDQPDFTFSPYKDFTSGSSLNSTGVSLEYLHTLGPALVNDLRFGYSSAEQRLDRGHSEIPTLVSGDGTLLPGSPLLLSSRDYASTSELSDSVVWIRGRHIVAAGGGYELNLPSSSNSFGQAGYFVFQNVVAFLLDQPFLLGLAASRQALPQLMLPDLDRSYRNNQFFGFVQDNLKLNPRIGLSLGLRYDSFGTLKNTGIEDAPFMPGPGTAIEQRIAGASIAYTSHGGGSVYQPDRNNWSGRLGVSCDLTGNGTTILRAGFGIYYDRPFGALVQSIQFNSLDFRFANLPPRSVNYLQPFRGSFGGFLGSPGPGGAPATFSGGLTNFFWINSGLRPPYVQTWFGGIQRQLARNLTFEVSQAGALGRKLVASDVVNRNFSVLPSPENSSGLLNPTVPAAIVYRSNAGSSDYLALSAIARYRTGRAVVQAAYTYSHSIDNQSDPLLGESVSPTAQSSGAAGIAAFTRQFDSRVDRASSDFDERHNFVFYSLYSLPSPESGVLKQLLRGWDVAELASFRSGFPFTVIAPSGINALRNNRANYLGGDTKGSASVAGGQQFLNPAVFADPAQTSPFALGTLGRNSIAGPGFFSIDASISKSFALPRLGESGRIVVRADAFNLLNHTNLANPDPFLASPTFGISQFGTSNVSFLERHSDEIPRQIRFQIKLVF
jgi:Carboxypeptidase regulatory-like domain/TonB-dependent Receptor Plug Domain